MPFALTHLLPYFTEANIGQLNNNNTTLQGHTYWLAGPLTHRFIHISFFCSHSCAVHCITLLTLTPVFLYTSESLLGMQHPTSIISTSLTNLLCRLVQKFSTLR